MDDPDRCTAAGAPVDVAFASKPALATRMIIAVLGAGVPARGVAGDEVNGVDRTLRSTFRTPEVGYVLAVASNRRIPVGMGWRRVDELTADLLGLALAVAVRVGAWSADVLLGPSDDPDPVGSPVGPVAAQRFHR